jgi:tetratricopeptide (TPR) repeat protein
MSKRPQRLGMARFEADEYYQMALEAFRKHKLDQAINQINEAIDLLPRRAELYAARGLFYLEDGIEDKAQENFQQALKLNRAELLAHYGRGVLAYQSGNMQEAMAHFSDAYTSDPKRPETLYYLALVYHRNKDHVVARRMMELAQENLPPDDKRRGDFQRWSREFEKIIRAEKQPTIKVGGVELKRE